MQILYSVIHHRCANQAAHASRRQLIGAALGLPVWHLPAWGGLGDMAPQASPPSLVLAEDAPADIDPSGWLVSEKLDGVRALWDGRQLRLRSGLRVAAPAPWLAGLPSGLALDGELWVGRGQFDAVSSAARTLQGKADERLWQAIEFHVFELPGEAGPFSDRAARIAEIAARSGGRSGPVRAAAQHPVADRRALAEWLQRVEAAGGEGLMLHRADAPYLTGRTGLLRKLKSQHDAEAQVIAHLPGKGKYAGLVGALQVRTPQGQVFALGSGLDDAERRHPPALGSWVTYRHRGYTKSGLPRFATFLRMHDPLIG